MSDRVSKCHVLEYHILEVILRNFHAVCLRGYTLVQDIGRGTATGGLSV